ncbi:MAG: hypothetical protein WC564_00225 [Patescibacteria group bacterium]
MKRDRLYKTVTMIIIAIVFALFSIIPLIGPSIGAYSLGLSRYSYEKHGLGKAFCLTSILIGELLFWTIIFLIISSCLTFEISQIPLCIAVIGLAVSYTLSTVVYLLGTYKAKIKKIKNDKP